MTNVHLIWGQIRYFQTWYDEGWHFSCVCNLRYFCKFSPIKTTWSNCNNIKIMTSAYFLVFMKYQCNDCRSTHVTTNIKIVLDEKSFIAPLKNRHFDGASFHWNPIKFFSVFGGGNYCKLDIRGYEVVNFKICVDFLRFSLSILYSYTDICESLAL